MRVALSTALLATMAYGAQNAANPARLVTFPEGNAEALGACDVRPDSIGCWDMDGRPAPNLVQAVLGGKQEVQRFNFQVGKKNRYLAIRNSQSLIVDLSSTSGANRPTRFPSQNPGGTQDEIKFFGIGALKDQGEATLVVRSMRPVSGDLTVPMISGTTARIEGKAFVIGMTQAVPPAQVPKVFPSGTPISGKLWSFALSLEGGGDPLGINYVPLDKRGAPIRYVDRNGIPMTSAQALGLEPGLLDRTYIPSKTSPVAAATVETVAGSPTFRIITSIDPSYIAALRVHWMRVPSYELGPFPLDPK